MRSELSEAVTVPQVFEAGARVAWSFDGRVRVLSRVADGTWRGVTPEGEDVYLCLANCVPSDLRVIAPAPSAGQRWESATRVVRITATDAGMAVATARWLLKHGFTYAGLAAAAPAPIHASEATPAREPAPSAPAPWTLDAARQLISATIGADAAPRRPDAFTSALCSLAECGAPMACTILATSAALTALEEGLPEHGAPAEWQTRRARARAVDVFKLAAQLDHVPTAVEAAIEMYVARRDRARS